MAEGNDPIEVLKQYLDAMMALPPRHNDGWALMTFDLRAQMARLMVRDVDRDDPRAVSTVLDGPTSGNLIWDAFTGWHPSHLRVRWNSFYLNGVTFALTGADDEVDMQRVIVATEPDGLFDDDEQIEFILKREPSGWKVHGIPGPIDLPPRSAGT